MKFDFSWLTNNLSNKIIALILAIFIWIVAITSLQINNTEDTVDMIIIKTVESRNLEYDLVQVEDMIDVTIQLRVPKTQQNIVSDDIVAFVNLTGKGQGQHNVHIEIVCPQGTEVVRISPTRHVVELKSLVSKDFKVQLGVPLSAAFTPDVVRVEGTEETLNSIDKVIALIVENSNATVANLVAVDSQGKEVENINYYPESTVVEIHTDFGEYVKQVPIIAKVELENELMEIENIDVSPSQVLVGGKKDVLDNISSILTNSVLVHSDGGKYEVTLNVPEGAILVEELDTVIVDVIVKDQKEQESVE